MDADRWQKINNIVDTLQDLEPEQRSTFLEQKYGGDQQLLAQVTELLNSLEAVQETGFLEDTQAYPRHLVSDFLAEDQSAKTSSLIDQQVGRYEILELVGHGGMGSVFIAERADDVYEQQVALKVMRRGMDTPSNIKRFNRERQILATLNHPNIARLLDGGVTDDGLPYLVMEFVDGTPLYKYCNGKRLSINERLELFKSIYSAVQHAHTNAVIHRDLKPSNILVTKEGQIKVLDFGIAKLLEPEGPMATLFQTRTGSRLLTLGYAAPEQVESSPVTTATDTHTLGILLYELLSGGHPFELDVGEQSVTAMERQIREATPSAPSKRFRSLPEHRQEDIAQQRDTSPSKLSATLQGDLDAIIIKALRKEPEARYGSVDQMLEDLNRYKRSLPLIAKSDTVTYRIGKFIKRNRNAVIGGLLILLAIAGLATYHINRITAERNIAETEAQKAESVKNFLIDIFRSSDPYSGEFEGKQLSARQLLVNGKNAISNDLQHQPDVYTEVLVAIGDALKSIDAFEEAKKSYEKALSQSSKTTQPLINKLWILTKLGDLNTNNMGLERAHNIALDARLLLEKIEHPPPALEASVFSVLGRIISIRDNYEQGNSYFEKADSIYVNTGIENSSEYIQMLTDYGRSLIYVSDYKKSIQTLLKSNRLHQKRFGKSTLTVAENYKFLGWAHRNLGNFKKSNSYLLQSIDLKKELIGEKSFRTAISMYHLARNYAISGDFEKSEELAKKVLAIYQEELQPPNNYIQMAKNYVAIATYNQGDFSEGEQLLQEIIEKRIQMYGEDHISYANSGEHLSIVYKETGRYQKAISLLQECIQINKRELGDRSRGVGVNLLKLADVYRAMGDYKQAQKYIRQSKSILENAVPDNHFRNAELNLKLGKLEQDSDNPQQARKYFKKAHNIYLDIFGEDSNRTKKAKSYLKQIAQT